MDLTNTTAQTPAAPEAPAPAASTPEAPRGSAAPSTEQFADALAALHAARSTAPATSAAPSAEPASGEPPAAPAAPAAQPQFEGFVAELRKIEAERDAVAREYNASKTQLEKLSAMEKAIAADPIRFLLDNGVTHEKMQDFLLNGAKPQDPAVLEAQRVAKETQEKLAAYEAKQQAAEEAAAVAEYKRSTVAPSLAADKFPLLHAVHGDQLVDHVYGVLNAEYAAGREVNIAETAGKLEKMIDDLYQRLAKVKQPSPAATPAPAPAARPRNLMLTNTPSGDVTPASTAPLTQEQRMANALAYLKQRQQSA